MVKVLRDNEELIVAFGQTKDAAERLSTLPNEFINQNSVLAGDGLNPFTACRLIKQKEVTPIDELYTEKSVIHALSEVANSSENRWQISQEFAPDIYRSTLGGDSQ